MFKSSILQSRILRFVFLTVLFTGIYVFSPVTGSCDLGNEPPWQASQPPNHTIVIESTDTYVKVAAVDDSGNMLVDALGEVMYYLIVL